MQKLFIKNRKNQRIAVVVNKPENSEGLAFVMHGLGGFKEQKHIQAIAEVFYNYSFTTILFDTTNSIGESDGKYEDATMQGYYEDLEDVIAWSRSQEWYKDPFFLAGHSLGGYSVVRFAETYPELIKGVFAFAPVISGKLNREADEKDAPEKLKKWKETGWNIEISKTSGKEYRLPWSHIEERLKHNLLPNASKLIMPILIMVGEKDEPCPPEHQKILYDKIPGKKEMVIVPGAPHSFKEDQYLTILKSNLSRWIESF